jgi:uncharacterized membrane protein YdbT with pleckstrin-like domain
MSAQETIIWEGSPSQITNLGVYVVCGLTFFLVVPLLYAIWRWIETRSHRFVVSDQRIRETDGVFSKRTDSIELYRVKDVVLMQPLSLRMFGLGNIELRSSDASSPLLVLPAVPNPAQLREKILLAAETRRDAKRVRELDVSDHL